MAYTSGFFDAVDQGGGDYDRVYSAATFAHYFSLLVQNGVFPDPSTGMQVKASTNPDMHVSVQPGSGWVNGYYITVEANAPEQLTVPTANPSLSRIDSVIMGLNYVDREIQLYIKSGAVSASPSAVSLQRDNDLYELELAQITVSAGMASITQANITDMRSNTNRCGIVKGMIDQIDTTDLFAQYDTAFQEWFADIKAQLSDNVATNLQNQINSLKIDKVNVLDKASIVQAQAGTDDTKWMTPALVKSAITELAPMVSAILSNETKALYGLGAGAVPDDVLAELGKYKQYWWRRRDSGHYILKETSISAPRPIYVNSSSVVTYTYGSSVTINQTDRTVTINNPQTLTTQRTPNASVFDPLIGSYYICDKTMRHPNTGKEIMLANTLYFIPDGTTITNNGENYYMATAAMKISTQKAAPGDWQYLHSSNRNAYPDSGTQDGYEYEYLGVPFDNAVTAPKIETGSYVGTEMYGQANPNTLTFGFKPKIVIISINGTSTYGGAIFMYGQTRSSYTGVLYNVDYSNMPFLTWNENSVSWYSTHRGYDQLNEAKTYNYLAIG